MVSSKYPQFSDDLATVVLVVVIVMLLLIMLAEKVSLSNCSSTAIPHINTGSRTFLYPNVSLRTRILNIITSNPIVTMISNAKLNQPSTMAVVPTPLLTLPLPKSWAMMDAATDAVCCHRTETRTNIEAMNMMARAIWETGLEGKGLTSRSLPEASSSSCHPGKVAKRRRHMKAKIIAMILRTVSNDQPKRETEYTYMRYGNTIISLN